MAIKPSGRVLMQIKRDATHRRSLAHKMNYPVDYQLAIARTINLRLEKLRAAGEVSEVKALEKSLARLGTRSFGACDRCGALIDFLRVAIDPAARLCETCEASLAHT
jgi:RNA polymerase-binding transcription factor DksA